MEEALGDSSGISRAGAAAGVCLLVVAAAVKPRLVWRQLELEEAPPHWKGAANGCFGAITSVSLY